MQIVPLILHVKKVLVSAHVLDYCAERMLIVKLKTTTLGAGVALDSSRDGTETAFLVSYIRLE